MVIKRPLFVENGKEAEIPLKMQKSKPENNTQIIAKLKKETEKRKTLNEQHKILKKNKCKWILLLRCNWQTFCGCI